MGVAYLDKYVTYYFTSMMWGAVLAFISLPLYLAGIGLPEIGKNIGVSTEMILIIPTIAAFLITTIISDREMIYSMVAIISGVVFLTIGMFVFLSYPAITGVVILTDYYYISAAKRVLLAILIMFPTFLIGGVTGKIFGEYFVSEQSRKERKELNEKMKEWKETLEKAIKEKEMEGKNEIEKSKGD
jgi:small-conductance mechanosensitive channel